MKSWAATLRQESRHRLRRSQPGCGTLSSVYCAGEHGRSYSEEPCGWPQVARAWKAEL